MNTKDKGLTVRELRMSLRGLHPRTLVHLHKDAISFTMFTTPQGRPRTADYKAIYRCRDRGISIQKIAEMLGVSRGSVQHALRSRP